MAIVHLSLIAIDNFQSKFQPFSRYFEDCAYLHISSRINQSTVGRAKFLVFNFFKFRLSSPAAPSKRSVYLCLSGPSVCWCVYTCNKIRYHRKFHSAYTQDTFNPSSWLLQCRFCIAQIPPLQHHCPLTAARPTHPFHTTTSHSLR